MLSGLSQNTFTVNNLRVIGYLFLMHIFVWHLHLAGKSVLLLMHKNKNPD